MFRSFAAVIVGYIVMMAMFLCTLGVAYFLMGPDNAFKPGTFDPSLLWWVISFPLAFIGSVTAGLICALIAPSGSRATVVLAGLVLAIGLMALVPRMMTDRPDPGPRTGSEPRLGAMMKTKQPVWSTAVNPLLGAAGIMLGARLHAAKKR